MAQTTTSLITSAVVGGIISILVNIVSIAYQNRIREQQNRERESQDWKKNILFLCKQLRRKCIELEYNVTIKPETKEPVDANGYKRDLEILSSLVTELETELDNSPPEMIDSEVASKTYRAINWYKNPPTPGNEFTTNLLKLDFVPLIEDVMDEIYETSERIETVPY